MTLYIHTPVNAPAVWPYTLADLRRDNPNVSFPVAPTPDDLAPFEVFPVSTTPRPDDTREQRHEEAMPQQAEDGTWLQAWTSRPATAEELAAWDAAHAPTPDWATFRGQLLISEGVAQVMSAARAAGCEPGVTALPLALERAQSGNIPEFAACWALVAAAGAPPPELLAELVGLAQSCHLPAEFVAALNPSTEQP